MSRVTLLRMVCLEVKDMELGLKGHCNEFVLGNVRPVELQSANTIFHVCIPTEAISFQVENLNISIIISTCDDSLLLVVWVTEGYTPAVWFDGFGLWGLKWDDRCLLPWIPNTYTSVWTSSDYLRCSVLCSLSSNTINAITHFGVGLYIILLLTVLNIENLEATFVVDDWDISHCDRACLESTIFNSEFFIKASILFQISLFQLVNLENTLCSWTLSE